MDASDLGEGARGQVPRSLLNNHQAEDDIPGIDQWLNEQVPINFLLTDEQPHFALYDGEHAIAKDRWMFGEIHYPHDDLASALILTDKRVLCLIGKDEEDVGFAIRHEDIIYCALLGLRTNSESLPFSFCIRTDRYIVEIRLQGRLLDEAKKANEYLKRRSRGHKRLTLGGSGPSGRINNRFSTMSPEEFEHLVAAIWEENGYQVGLTEKGGDMGVDVVAEKAGRRILIQAKRWSPDNKVGIETIQRTAGLLVDRQWDPDGVVVVSTSGFTKNAVERADQIGGMKLMGPSELSRISGR